MLHPSLARLARLRPHRACSEIPVLAYGLGIYARRFSTQQGQEEPSVNPLPQCSKWEGTPELPYINQKDILKELEKHVNRPRLRHVFLLWGAKSVGKTGALLLKAEEWEKRGHPVIEVDLKGFDGTLATFATMLHNATTAALARHKRTLPKERLEEALMAQQFRAKSATSKTLTVRRHVLAARFIHLWRSIPQGIRAYFHILAGKTPSAKDVEPTIAAGDALGPFVNSIAASVGAWKMPKAVDFVSVFEMLEEIAQQPRNPSLWDKFRGMFTSVKKLPPIVIIREVQRLDHLTDAPELGREVFSRLFEYFEPRKQGRSHVPVIIETSDFLWSRMKQILSSQESFLAVQMGPWSRDEAEKILVRDTLDGQPAPIFTQEEFNKIWDFSGGHAGTIYFIHSRLIAGTSLDKIIAEYRLEVDGIVQNVVGDGRVLAVITKRKDFLQQLCSAGYKLNALEDDSSEMMYFLQSNVLFSDGVSVRPRNKVYEDSIGRLLQ